MSRGRDPGLSAPSVEAVHAVTSLIAGKRLPTLRHGDTLG